MGINRKAAGFVLKRFKVQPVLYCNALDTPSKNGIA